MLWRDIIGSIKSSIKKRNSSASKLGKVNAKLNDSLENSSNISKIEGEILSFNEGEPVVSEFDLEDGEYDYYVVLKEIRPIDFLMGN